LHTPRVLTAEGGCSYRIGLWMQEGSAKPKALLLIAVVLYVLPPLFVLQIP
jgi:hypothetical protein